MLASSGTRKGAAPPDQLAGVAVQTFEDRVWPLVVIPGDWWPEKHELNDFGGVRQQRNAPILKAEVEVALELPRLRGVAPVDRVIRTTLATRLPADLTVMDRSSRDAAELPPRRRRDDTMAMPVTRHHTAADLASMPDDGQRYEIVRGELLVSPSPDAWHQLILTRLCAVFLPYLQAAGLVDQLIRAPADITFADDTVLQPDLVVADTAAAVRSGKWTDVTTLFLVVEVISPSTARNDRGVKRLEYQGHRIAQYWIVDREQRQVEVWTPEAEAPVIERERLTWQHPALTDECVIALAKLFDFG
jgi:Uma2 family endonuclease